METQVWDKVSPSKSAVKWCHFWSFKNVNIQYDSSTM